MRDPLTIRRVDISEGPRDGSVSALPPALHLVVLSGTIPGALIRFEPVGIRVGRASDNSAQFVEESISRYHATLWTDENGQPWLSDLGSTNGTHHNGRIIPRQAPVRLKVGDVIQFGLSVTVKFVSLDPCEEEVQRALYDRAVRDDLTGLYNRAFFLDRMTTPSYRVGTDHRGLAVLLLDIDYFKQVNDTLGHDAGDAVLRQVAAVLRNSTRGEDLVARYGGEEFVVAISVPTPRLAVFVAERIRRSLSDCEIRAGARSLRVTASIGVAFDTVDRPRKSADLIASADLCMYQAKAAGRNRIVCDALSTPNGSSPRGTSLIATPG